MHRKRLYNYKKNVFKIFHDILAKYELKEQGTIYDRTC